MFLFLHFENQNETVFFLSEYGAITVQSPLLKHPTSKYGVCSLSEKTDF